MSQVPKSETNKRLGYPDDARLLIINADDFGMCHATNAAIFRTLTEGVVCSTTLMVPCPWALHAMHWLRDNPDDPDHEAMQEFLGKGRRSHLQYGREMFGWGVFVLRLA